MATLGDLLARRDAQRFVGRETELAVLRLFLEGEVEASVILLHGPGGIGKSTLLRRIASEAQACGFSVAWIDGRELAPVPDALEDAFPDPNDDERPFVVIDSYERIAALGAYLRGTLLPTLPESARVAIAGRESFEAAWREGGWEHLAVHLGLDPMTDEESREVLRAGGVEDAEVAGAVADWAGGWPLALTLAAEATNADPDWEPARGLRRPEVVEPLIRRIADADLPGAHMATLGAAAIARQTDPELLRDVVPDRSAAEEFEWLASRSFVKSLGSGVAPHELVRRALLADLRRRDSLLERELRRRVADHFYERALATGGLLWIIDLAHLAENPVFRWGFSWEASARYRVDDVRPGDAEEIAIAVTERGKRLTVPSRFLAEAPEHVTICRDRDDRVCGFAVSMTPATAPSFAAEGPVLGPRLEHARGLDPPGETVVVRSAADLVDDPRFGVIGMLGMATLLKSASDNPRYVYLPIDPGLSGAREFAAAAGAVHVPSLDSALGERLIECHLIDWGEGGLLAAQREFIYRELGLEPPPRPSARQPASFEVVREALRNFQDDGRLAGNELARGGTLPERAESVRSQIVEAAARAFGSGPREQMLRRVAERGYLDPAPSHEVAANELHLSRSSYFRRLREASERIAEELAGN